MDLRIIVVTFAVSMATDATTISSSIVLKYFAIFDDVIYPTTNHTIESPSHVTLQTCAQLCFNKSIHREILPRHIARTKREKHSIDMLLNRKPEMVINSMQSQINQPEHRDRCSAFEYIYSIGYCILLKHSAAHDVHGYRSLKQAKGTAYFELSKSMLALYKKKENTVLSGENTYQNALNSSSVTDCASTCMKAVDLTCNSFAYSERMRICAISSHVPDVDTSLQTTQAYDYYQYSGVWPCNVTLLWAYRPRVIASQRYPYAYLGHLSCYFRLVAPRGQQIVLRVKTFFTNQTVCEDNGAGVFIFDSEDQTARADEAFCQVSDSRRHKTFKSSNGTVLVRISQNQNLVIARLVYDYVEKSSNCASSPCLFNAACIETEHSFKCTCPHGTSGKRCDKYIGECYRSPCRNGTCSPSDSVSGYKCACVKGFTGANCEYNINECFSSPCLHGLCEDHVNGYKCVCNEPFTGHNCEVNKSLASCSRHVCRFGTCAINRTGSYCQCFPGFTGSFCETDIDDCENSPCAHGLCVDHVNSYQCTCSRGYAGKHCDILVGDPCRGNPCYHGYCSVGNKGFSCVCASGYTGLKCESELTACRSECQHGYCIKVNSSDSKCICYKNFTGSHCEKSMSECKDGRCQGGNNISATLPNRNESLHTTNNMPISVKAANPTVPTIYTHYVPHNTLTVNPTKITTASIQSHTAHMSTRINGFAPPNVNNTAYQQVTVSSLKDTVNPQFSTKNISGTTVTPPAPSRSKSTTVFSIAPSYTLTDILQSEPLVSKVSSSGSDISTKSVPSTKNTLEIISSSTSSSGNNRVTTKKTERTTDQYEGYKTKQSTILRTSEQTTYQDIFATKTKPSVQETAQPKGQLTTEKNEESTVQPLSERVNGTNNNLPTTTIIVPSYTLEIPSTTETPKAIVTAVNKSTTNSINVSTENALSSAALFQGKGVNDVITIESIVIGALFVVLIIVLAMGLFAFYKHRHSGTIYISSSDPPAHRDNTPVKKRYSAREIHSDLRSGKLFQPQCVSSELYQRQDDARTPVYTMPKRRYTTKVPSSKASSSTTSPVSSRSDNYDEVESPDVTLPSKIRRLVPVEGSVDRRSVVNITRGKGVITTPTPEHGRFRQNKSFERNDTRSYSEQDQGDSSLSSNENPFSKRDDGTVVLNLSDKHTRTHEEVQILLEEMLDAEDYLTLRRPGMRKSVHYISGTEDGKSEA